MTDTNIRATDRECIHDFAAREPHFFHEVLIQWWFDDTEDYRKMRAAAVDRDELCETVSDFQRVCSERAERALANGQRTANVVISADALIAWCEATERQLDEVARQMFSLLTKAKS